MTEEFKQFLHRPADIQAVTINCGPDEAAAGRAREPSMLGSEIRPGDTVLPLSTQLREQTAQLHRQIETVMRLPDAIQTGDDYRAWLCRYLGLYEPLGVGDHRSRALLRGLPQVWRAILVILPGNARQFRAKGASTSCRRR